jgi:hypothetical protein
MSETESVISGIGTEAAAKTLVKVAIYDKPAIFCDAKEVRSIAEI